MQRIKRSPVKDLPALLLLALLFFFAVPAHAQWHDRLVSATPSSLSFAATIGGAAPSLQAVVIVSKWGTNLPVTLSADQPWITMSANSGTTQATIQFGVNPTGLTAGTYSGHILVTTAGVTGSPYSIPVTLTVNTSAGAVLTTNITSLAFGSVSLGSTSVLSAVLSNSGTGSIAISNVTLAGPGFTISGISTGIILNPGQTDTLNVTFAPTATGSVTGSVTIASNASNSAVSIPLSGTSVQGEQHSVTLTWNASSSSVLGYNIYRSGASSGPFSRLNASLDTLLSYTDTDVQAGQTYYYEVTSVDSTNTESGYSNQVSAVIP